MPIVGEVATMVMPMLASQSLHDTFPWRVTCTVTGLVESCNNAEFTSVEKRVSL